MADQEEDYSSLPLLDRFVHKIWKVRKQAYEDATRSFERAPDEADPVYRPFLQDPSLWKGAVADSNVAAQQEAVAALCAFLKCAGPQACIRTRSAAIPPLIEKGLASTRAATKATSLEALLLYIELDTPGPVVDDLIPALSHKQPKIVAAVLSALHSIYHVYGCRTVDPKPVLKALPKVFGHADKNVRAEAQGLAVELYRWLREAMKHSFWGDLKPVQQQDLEALFEKAKQDPSPTQERLLRSQQDARAAASNGGGEGGSSDVPDDHAEEAPEVDAFDLAEPVDVTSKIPKDLHESLASTKWKDRKDGLDALHAAVNVPRIKEADFGELVRSSLAKCMKDANIAVVTVAANCVELLAKGLRGDFAKYRSGIMAPMMERLKEKKQSVADALGAALDAVFASTGLTECLDETLQSLTNKNPQVKQESARFLIRCLRTTRDAPSKAEVKAISEAAIKLLAESTEGLRSSAAEILGTVMKIRGERAMNPYIDGIDDIRKAKVKEYFEKAEVRAKDKPKPVAPAPTAKAGKGPAGKKASDRKPATGLHKAPPAAAAAPAATEDDSAQAPLQARPTARSIPSKAGGSSKASSSIPGAGLRLKKKGAGPDGAAPASAHASPVKAPAARSIPSPVAQEEAPSGPKVGLAGRGLAGRPLGKPNRATPEPAAPAASPGLSVVERAELEELRAENERLRRLTEELRSDKSRLTSQVYELQNQNAELVEDHTRDMLSVKAKETQLVRARSDAEAAQQTCHKQQREMERLKRELSRAMRAASPGPGSGPGQADFGEHIYRDSTTTSTGGANGTGHNHHHHQQQQQQQQPSQHHPHHHALGRPLPRRPPFGSHLSSSEEKENGGPDAFDLRSAKLSPTSLSSAVSSTGTGGGRHSPTFGDGHAAGAGGVGSAGVPLSRTATASSRSTLVGSGGGGNNNNKNSMDNETNAEGIETWKRAAQVTTALKAKIEQMKVRQGINKT